MKQLPLAATLIILVIVSSVAFEVFGPEVFGPADTKSVLLDSEKVRSITAEEYASAVRSTPDVNARDKNGMTPLHFAAMSGTPAFIAALLEAGASGSAKTEKGETPFDLAESNDKVKGTAAYRALNAAQYK